jgi:hypothetical protein
VTHSITAKDVPELRANMVADARDFKKNFPEKNQWATSLEAAELFWVARDMLQIAEVAAESLPAFTIEAEDIPAPHGVLVWEGTLHTIAGFSWKVVGGSVHLNALVPGRLAAERLAGFVLEQQESERIRIDHLIPVRRASTEAAKERLIKEKMANGVRSELWSDVELPIPLGKEVNPDNIRCSTMMADELDRKIGVLLPTIAMSLWLLMDQTLASREMVRSSRHGMKTIARLDASLLTETRYVTLRRKAVNPSYGEGEGTQRSHRWWTRGHWRKVPYGPGKTRRRPTWIAPYISGPDGAPILDPDKLVSVLRK